MFGFQMFAGMMIVWRWTALSDLTGCGPSKKGNYTKGAKLTCHSKDQLGLGII